MSDKDLFAYLAERLSCVDGTVLYPKGDGRVEIPQSLVRLMGWKNKCRVEIGLSGHQRLCLTGNERTATARHLGSVVVSMERVRIPASILRKAELDIGDRKSVVVVPQMPSSFCMDKDPCLSVVPDLGSRFNMARAWFEAIGQRNCELLAASLEGKPVLADPEPVIPPDPVQEMVENLREPSQPPKLFFPSPFKPTVIRVIGKPFLFQAHWVATSGGGTFAAHKDDACPLCKDRGPERMYLIPVLRRGADMEQAGFLLAKEELRAVIGKVLAGANPTSLDMILYYRPFAYGMFEVFKNPPEPIPEGVLEKAQETCGNPDAFLDSVFKESFAPTVPARSPAVLVKGHFAAGLAPDNFEE